MESSLLHKIKNLPGNDKCVDCPNVNPMWASLSHGTLICMECSGRHRGMGVHLSFVRSLDLDSWTEKQTTMMLNGGNGNFATFWRDHSNAKHDSDDKYVYKYDSNVAEWYRQRLKAGVEGRPLPNLQDVIDDLEQKAKERVERKKNTYTSISSQGSHGKSNGKVTSMSNRKREDTPSWTSSFLASLQYWVYRRIRVPTRNHRLVAVSCLTFYIGTLSQGRNTQSFPLFHVQRAFSLMIRALLASTLIQSIRSTTWFTSSDCKRKASPIPIATSVFQDWITKGRIQRHARYDIYFPPNATVGSNIDKAILFIPELLVDPIAYAPVLSKLSEEGKLLIVCLNLHSKSYRHGIPMSWAVCKGKWRTEAVHHIQTLLGMTIGEWIGMGHGYGASVLNEVITQSEASEPLGKSSRRILWSPLSLGSVADYSNSSGFILGASRDDIAESLCPMKVLSKKLLLSDKSKANNGSKNWTLDIIPGGNHCGFGHYGPLDIPVRDGIRSISLNQQMNSCFRKTLDFIQYRETKSHEESKAKKD